MDGRLHSPSQLRLNVDPVPVSSVVPGLAERAPRADASPWRAARWRLTDPIVPALVLGGAVGAGLLGVWDPLVWVVFAMLAGYSLSGST